MKNPLHRDDFEIFLEEEVNQHRMYPSDQIWRNIQQDLHGHKKWPALTVITLFVISALVVGTVLIKPQGKTLNTATNITAQTNDAVTAAQPAPENVQEHFSPEHITQQTIADVTADIDITDNLANALAAYNTNIPEFMPPNYVQAPQIQDYSTASQANENINDNAFITMPVSAPAIPGTNAATKAVAITASHTKNNAAVLNWMNMVPEANPHYASTPLIPGIGTPRKTATGSFMFSLFGKLSPNAYQGLSIEDNFSEPVRKPFTLKPKGRRFDFAFYATPSISYRRLIYANPKAPNVYVSGIPVNAGYIVDLNRDIRNKPAVGYEVGAAIGYKLNNVVTVRGGFQFNVREYDIEAYKQSSSSVSSFGTLPGSVDVSNQVGPGYSDKVILKNSYYELSMPLSVDVRIWKSGRFGLGAATGIQPTYTFDKDPFIITSDYKNYIDGSKLVRNWNLNTNLETYISYQTGQFKWQLGPQFRYQLLSTLSGNYPAKQHLLDYGIKIGFVKSLP